MRAWFWILRAYLLLVTAAAAQEMGSVGGVVVQSVTQEPMAGVHVRIWLVDRGQTDNPAYGATTDEHGRFSISSLRPGTYFLQPLVPGFVPMKRHGPDAPAAPVAIIKPGQRVEDLRIELAREVDLSGLVTDEHGEPIEGVHVVAEAAAGQTYLGWKETGTCLSDDRGEFHIAMPPGKYILKAEPDTGDPAVAEEIRSDGTKETAPRPMFYPNSTDKAHATVVEVHTDRAGLDFRLPHGEALSISGTVSGAPADCPVELTLQVGYSEGEVQYDQKASADGQGRFSIPHVDPGKYRLYAGCETGGRALRSQMQEVTLENSSITVDLVLVPGRELSGKVEPAPGAGRTVRLESTSSDNGWGPSRNGAVVADGNFQITGIQPDRYRVLLTPPSEAEYIRVTLDDAPAIHSTIDLRRGGSKLKIAIGRAGAIAGVVENHPNAMVFLLPDGDYMLETLRVHQTGNDGSFRFAGLAPGKYRLYAVDIVAGQKWQKFEEAAAVAELVEVKPGETTNVNAKIVAQ